MTFTDFLNITVRREFIKLSLIGFEEYLNFIVWKLHWALKSSRLINRYNSYADFKLSIIQKITSCNLRIVLQTLSWLWQCYLWPCVQHVIPRYIRANQSNAAFAITRALPAAWFRVSLPQTLVSKTISILQNL